VRAQREAVFGDAGQHIADLDRNARPAASCQATGAVNSTVPSRSGQRGRGRRRRRSRRRRQCGRGASMRRRGATTRAFDVAAGGANPGIDPRRDSPSATSSKVGSPLPCPSPGLKRDTAVAERPPPEGRCARPLTETIRRASSRWAMRRGGIRPLLRGQRIDSLPSRVTNTVPANVRA